MKVRIVIEIIFEDYGNEIYKSEKKYFIRYDRGEIAQKFVEVQISESDVKAAQVSAQEAYQTFLKYQ